MNQDIIKNNEYKDLILKIKNQIKQSQIKASISVNKELLKLYWNIAEMIISKQKTSSWGDGIIDTISKDLKKDFPHMKGFSRRNIHYMKEWYLYWIEIVQQPVAQITLDKVYQIPWGHNLAIMTKAKTKEEAIYYVNKTIENNWSRSVLVHQIESNLFYRQGGAVNNFKENLPEINSDLAVQMLKDPYCFDFLSLTERYNEKELERSLIDNITNFLLELGQGFSFLGKQYKLEISNKEFYIDLLFYHVKLHCFIVVELKTGEFEPEYSGKLNFYISAVDDLLTDKSKDNPTIGLLICKDKDNTIVEYSLKDIKKPIGVSQYQLTRILPDNYKKSLPSIEEIEAEIEAETGGENE